MRQQFAHGMPSHAQNEIGLTLTTKQSWLLAIAILILCGILLFFGHKDWQRQRQMRLEFEEYLRTRSTSKVDEGLLLKAKQSGHFQKERGTALPATGGLPGG